MLSIYWLTNSALVYEPNAGGGCLLQGLSVRVMIVSRGPTELIQQFRLSGVVHIGSRALLDINLIWFGYITRLSHLPSRS